MLFSSEVTEEMVSLVDEIFKARLEKNKAEVSKKTTMLEVQQSKSEMIRLGWISKCGCVYPHLTNLLERPYFWAKIEAWN